MRLSESLEHRSSLAAMSYPLCPKRVIWKANQKPSAHLLPLDAFPCKFGASRGAAGGHAGGLGGIPSSARYRLCANEGFDPARQNRGRIASAKWARRSRGLRSVWDVSHEESPGSTGQERKAETVVQETTSVVATRRLGKPLPEQTQIGALWGGPSCARVAR